MHVLCLKWSDFFQSHVVVKDTEYCEYYVNLMECPCSN